MSMIEQIGICCTATKSMKVDTLPQQFIMEISHTHQVSITRFVVTRI
jgi:hypothetical protein